MDTRMGQNYFYCFLLCRLHLLNIMFCPRYPILRVIVSIWSIGQAMMRKVQKHQNISYS